MHAEKRLFCHMTSFEDRVPDRSIVPYIPLRTSDKPEPIPAWNVSATGGSILFRNNCASPTQFRTSKGCGILHEEKKGRSTGPNIRKGGV